MKLSKLFRVASCCVAVAIVTVGYAPYSSAAVVGAEEFLNTELRTETISDISALLARQDVADQLEKLGVSPELVLKRVENMTQDELHALNGAIDQQVAGGDVIAVIGIVFVVLLILELLGVTDVFTGI